MKKYALCFLLSSFILFINTLTLTHADPILDQVSPTFQSTIIVGTDGYHWQQEVTAGMDGILSGIELLVGGDLSYGTRFSINLGAAWQSDQNDFETIFSTTQAGWNLIDVSSANIFLSEGAQYVIGLHGLNPWMPGMTFQTNHYYDEYTSGQLFINGSNATENHDLVFNTYMEPVPEPATMLLLASGLLGFAGFRRKFRKA